MSVPMRKHLTNDDTISCFTKEGCVFRIPFHIAKKYLISKGNAKTKDLRSKHLLEAQSVDVDMFFKEMDKKYTEAGALLRGTRHREGLSQKEFAKKIEVTQSNLSKMESGKRAIGKIIAKRIEKEFGVDYRYFLG